MPSSKIIDRTTFVLGVLLLLLGVFTPAHPPAPPNVIDRFCLPAVSIGGVWTLVGIVVGLWAVLGSLARGGGDKQEGTEHDKLVGLLVIGGIVLSLTLAIVAYAAGEMVTVVANKDGTTVPRDYPWITRAMVVGLLVPLGGVVMSAYGLITSLMRERSKPTDFGSYGPGERAAFAVYEQAMEENTRNANKMGLIVAGAMFVVVTLVVLAFPPEKKELAPAARPAATSPQ